VNELLPPKITKTAAVVIMFQNKLINKALLVGRGRDTSFLKGVLAGESGNEFRGSLVHLTVPPGEIEPVKIFINYTISVNSLDLIK
jgi:hypothetical protein